MGREVEPEKTETILVVDDRPDNVELLSMLLTLQGYQVEQSERGDLAIETAQARPPDLILLDISMPNMDGFEVCQKLKENTQTQNIPIIFISSLNEASDKAKAFEYGGNDYIAKPFQLEEVVARVRNQLQISRLKTELEAKNARLEQELQMRKTVEQKLLDLNQQLNELAALDSLTQLANRRKFDEFLSREWQRGQREQHGISLIFCDIDYFKLYNDSYGHQSGDACLQEVAKAITSAVRRPADLVARYGGEEFAIILPQTPAQNALQVAEAIRMQVKQLAIPHCTSLVSDRISLSLGVTCVVPQPKYTKQQFLITADKALYQAKKQGRDRAVSLTID